MPSPSLFSLAPKHVLAPQTLARPCPLPLIRTAAAPLFGPPRVGRGGLAIGRGRSIVPGATAVSGIESDRDLAVKRREEKPIIVIDNYDSFTYNLCQYLGELGANFEVYRNDELTLDDVKRKNPRGLHISPGPGSPQDSGISLQTVLELGPSIPLFGVCMGLQFIGEAFGAWTEDGLIMAARHKKYRHIQGVQFHPESIITSEGKTMILNFIKLIDKLDSDPLGKENFRPNASRKMLHFSNA